MRIRDMEIGSWPGAFWRPHGEAGTPSCITNAAVRRSAQTDCPESPARSPMARSNCVRQQSVGCASVAKELHAIDAVVGGQGVAICGDVVVSNELRNALLVKAHPLSLPGYGIYLVSMPLSPRAPVIEAFSTWMRAVS